MCKCIISNKIHASSYNLHLCYQQSKTTMYCSLNVWSVCSINSLFILLILWQNEWSRNCSPFRSTWVSSIYGFWLPHWYLHTFVQYCACVSHNIVLWKCVRLYLFRMKNPQQTKRSHLCALLRPRTLS